MKNPSFIGAAVGAAARPQMMSDPRGALTQRPATIHAHAWPQRSITDRPAPAAQRRPPLRSAQASVIDGARTLTYRRVRQPDDRPQVERQAERLRRVTPPSQQPARSDRQHGHAPLTLVAA